MPLLVLVLRILGVALGLALIGIGIPLFIMPIPVGLIVIAIGILVLLLSSTQAVAIVRALRHRFGALDGALSRAERTGPRLLQRILKTTRPAP